MPDELPSEIIELATSFARRAHRRFPSIEFDDFRQELLIAAWRAIPRFDADQGVTLRTFIAKRLHFAATDVLRQYGGVSRTRYKALTEEEREFARVILLDAAALAFGAFDDELGKDVRQEEEGFAEVETRLTIVAILDAMLPSHAEVLRRHYLDGRTLAELGRNVYGVTESRVCQQVRQARKRALDIAA